jgi:hypothetical protein
MNLKATNTAPARGMVIALTLVTLVMLVLGFALSGMWLGIALATGVVSAWLLGLRNPQLNDTFVDIGLICVFALAIAGILVRAPVLLMEGACASALMCWSFMRFQLRMAAVKRVDHAEEMAQSHTRWALLAGAGGLALAGLAALVRTNFTFASVFFAGLFVTLLLSLVIGRWRGEK